MKLQVVEKWPMGLDKKTTMFMKDLCADALQWCEVLQKLKWSNFGMGFWT
jgi:hypothetical protein